MTEKGKILKSASIIALLTILSRICGYLRDQRIALLLGTSPVADSFILAFRIPNLVRRFTGEGALGASFIPVFTSYLRGESREVTWQFARRSFWDLAIILAVVAAKGNERQKRDFLLASVTWWAGWTSATIARAVYPPPKSRSLQSPPPQA